MAISRRDFLISSGLGAIATGLPGCSGPSRRDPPTSSAPADYTIHIAPGLVELAPDRIIATTLYNNQFPGPLIRLREGRPATVDLYNDTDTPEQLHWHGQFVPADVDGCGREEGTPFIPARGHRSHAQPDVIGMSEPKPPFPVPLPAVSWRNPVPTRYVHYSSGPWVRSGFPVEMTQLFKGKVTPP